MERYKVDVHRQNMSTNMTKKEYLDMRNWPIRDANVGFNE